MATANFTLDQLRNLQIANRRRIIKLIGTAQAIADDPNHTATQLHAQIDILQRIGGQLSDVDIQILPQLTDPDEIDAEVEETGQVHDNILTILSGLGLANATLNRRDDDERASVAASNQSHASPVAYNSSASLPMLPKLELPKFSGNPLAWQSFWDSYESAVHNNPTLTPVSKFNYLRASLFGVAKDAIAGLAVTNGNYDSAITLIQERFGQRQAIVNAHVEDLVNIAKASSDTNSLRKLYDACETHIRGLQALDISTDGTGGIILTPILLSKIPDDVRLILSRKNNGTIGDLDHLRKLFRDEIEAREANRVSKTDPIGGKVYNSRPQESLFSTATLMTTEKQYCGYCKENGHSSFDCNKYTTVNQRMAKVKNDRCCLNCLSSRHRTNDCKSTKSCRFCGKHHHTTLCFQNNQNAKTEGRNNDQGNRQSVRNNTNLSITQPVVDPSPVSTPTLLTNSTSIWMQTALVSAPDKLGNHHTLRLLFDSGSHRSYVTQAVAFKLSLKTERSEMLSIAPFGQQYSTPKRFPVTTLKCSSRNDSNVYPISAAIVPLITCPIYRTVIDTPSTTLKSLQLADPLTDDSQHTEIDILIGLDHYWDLINNQCFRLPDENLTAVSSVFGWLVSGTIKDTSAQFQPSSALFIGSTNTEDASLMKFWETESLDHADIYSKDQVIERDMVHQRFNETIIMKDGRYEVGLPWKENAYLLPTNYGLCHKRFRSLVKRLTKDDMVSRYNDVLQQQIDHKFIEKVDKPYESSGIVHYISHHPIIKDDRATTKLRVVYDASAKLTQNHPSLNESIYTGPNLVSDLVGLLFQFRQHKIVILADVEKAFLQVGLRPEDRDATRFFWLKNPNKPFSEENVETYRFLRVLFGATSSPFLLAATIQYHLKNTKDPIATKMINNFYVDNLVIGADDVGEAKEIYNGAKKIMLDGGMNLREWVSNNKEFCQSLPVEDRVTTATVKVLGLSWTIDTDILTIKGVPELVVSPKTTKRQILQTIAKVFDPLGFVSPVIVTAKIFIQKLWKLGINWDSAPTEDIIAEWMELNKQLSLLSTVKIPRHLTSNANAELHVFVDASAKAYAAVAYLRCSVDGYYTSNLAYSKSRVTPIKPISTPRLELLAAVMGCQLANLVSTTYSTSKIQIWSDSQVVLYWILNKTQKQGIFVSNRIREISESGFEFRYCPTTDNPADLPSRGTSTPELINSDLWWQGPKWLVNPETTWPPNVIASVPKLFEPFEEPTLVAVPRRDETFPFDIDPKRYSSLRKLLRVTALCQRFIDRIRKTTTNVGPVETYEYQAVQLKWIKSIQHNSFKDQHTLLNKKRTDVTIRKLSMYLEDNIIRCRGRISNATTSDRAKNPVLLPKNSVFTDLVIKDTHNRLYHQGVRHTLSMLRQSYWLQNGRQQVRFVLKRCLVCKLWEGRSFSNPPPPPLPMSRTTKAPAFSYTGCDFAGPLYIHNGIQTTKAYICLFTCAVTRAVHLEVVEDLTTASFLMALRRFISRRGVPLEIISDNAKTFKLAKQILERIHQNIITAEDTINYICSQNIKWKYNVERAPWWGGFFERMVGLTKRTLLKAVGKARLTLLELATFLAEVEAVLNTRPLTYVHDELSEDGPLCPRDFLSEARFFGLPTALVDLDEDFDAHDVSARTLLTKLHQRQHLLDKFWNIWTNDYLTNLREHHIQAKGSKMNPYTPKIGDIVLIKEEGVKRAHWKLGAIQYLYTSQNDGQVRAAQVKCNNKLFQRSISHLYPLEITTQIPLQEPVQVDQTETQTSSRSTRQAAIRAKRAIKDAYDTDNSQ